MLVTFSCVVFSYYCLLTIDKDEGSPAGHLILFRSVLLRNHITQ